MPAADARAADWIVEALRTFAESVTSLVPGGFEAYVRVFHPAYREGIRVRWAQIAAASGKKAHRAMQLTAFTGSRSLYDSLPGVFDEAPEVGSLPVELTEPLIATFSRYTSTPDRCWFAVWDGFGGLLEDVRLAPTFQLPGRRYHLLSGSLDAASETVEDAIGAQSANLWWPDDHAWCVATEIDLNSTYIACNRACADAILALPAIEALPIDPLSGITINSDSLNAVP